MTAPAPPPEMPGIGAPGRGGAPRHHAAEQQGDQPRVLAGRYRLDSVLGRGSMGTVWAATDQVLHRQVAIKEIDFPAGTPAAERAQLEHRTLREARAIARLSNPYVITLFDILTLDNGPVIVMELLRSRSLAEILRKVGRLPDGQTATIGVAVASGLLAAHAAGITHRDVKPGNVLICDDGRIKLTDFGIARASGEQTMTATGLLLGSPAYIAPEVANGVPAGPASDAWSLGGLLFACVEGRPPFDQGTAIATLTSVVKDPVPPHPHSDRLGAVVSGLLVKTPALRMRIDRALTIMRGIADDPSGTHLAAVSRIPRDDAPPGQGPTPTGAARSLGPEQSGAADPESTQAGAGRSAPAPTGATRSAPARPVPTGGPYPTGAQIGTGGPYPTGAAHISTGGPYPNAGTLRPPAASPADSSTRPPGAPAGQWPGSTPYRPPAPRPGPTQNSQSSLRPGELPGGLPSRSTGMAGPVVGLGPRPGAADHELPPPPWAQSQSASLAALPAVAAPGPSRRLRRAIAVVVALIAGAAGFFGVRIIADLATQAASAPAQLVAPASADFADQLPAASPVR